jgi:hypothetical protein
MFMQMVFATRTRLVRCDAPSLHQRSNASGELASLVARVRRCVRPVTHGEFDRWAEARIKIARMTLTIKLDGNWSSFQLANSAPPLSVTDSAIAPSARIDILCATARMEHVALVSGSSVRSCLRGDAHTVARCPRAHDAMALRV